MIAIGRKIGKLRGDILQRNVLNILVSKLGKSNKGKTGSKMLDHWKNKYDFLGKTMLKDPG